MADRKLEIAVFGAGKMGTVLAWDLCRSPEVARVTLVDASAAGLARAKTWIDGFGFGAELVAAELDVLNDRAGVAQVLGRSGAAAIAMPDRRISYTLIEAAIDHRCHCVDLLEEYHRRPDSKEQEGSLANEAKGEELHRRAGDHGVVVLDGMGLEPGLTNVSAGAGIRRTDRGAPGLVVAVRVGGVPAEPFKDRNPLQYMITWSFEHALREYVIPTEAIRDGRATPVASADEFEDVAVPRPQGGVYQLQAAITPGMPSYLHTWRDLPWRLQTFDAKTLRWPAHWPLIRAFKDLGLLEENVRRVIAPVLTDKLKPEPGSYDLAVMQNTVDGAIGGERCRQTFRMTVEGDPDSRLSGMARATAFPAAWGALALASGRLASPGGIWAPEEIVYDHPDGGPRHYADLKTYLAADDRRVRILESREPIV